MSSSCSEDDSDAGRIISTQYDDDLDLDAQRRQRREAAAKQRQQQIENRRRERERQAEERREKLAQSKRRKRPANSSDDDSDAGSADLLADKSPAPSPSPSPPRNRISNNNNYNRKLNNASPLTSASAKVNSASNNNKTGGGGGIGIIGSGRKPAVKWKPKYYDSSDDDDEQDKFRSSRDNNTFRNNGSAAATSNNNTSMNTNSSNGTTKVTSERAKLNAKVAAQKRFGNQSDSDDSDDAGGFEAMRKAMRIKKEREAAKKAAAAKNSRDSSSPSIPSPEDRKMSYNTAFNTGNSSNKNRPTFAPSSPDTMDVDDSPRIKRPTSRGGVITKSLAQLTQNLQSDSDSDDDGNDMAKLFRERKAKKEAEERARKEAARRHNPMALEKHEREQREYLNAQNAEDRKRLSPKKPEKSLEGTEIVLRGDDTEEDVNSELGLSQSDMGDDTPNKGGGKGDGFISTKPSRGMYKRRGSAKDDDSDISDTPNKKKQRNSPSKAMQDSFDDGLWDDPSSDQDVRMEMNSDSDSDNGGAKRGRGRKRTNNGTTQPRKRSRSTKAAADSDDDDSDAPAVTQKKKKAPSKKTTRRRRSNSDSDDEPRKRGGGGGGEMPWASRYGIDEDEKSDVSEDERERRKRQLKPDFANPKLGPPGPLVPFVLSKTWRRGDALVGAEDDAVVDDEDEDRKMPAAPDSDADQVPASINRYLKDYQREGVQFIYSSVIKGKGCILGDDMGLGKTVQMISLIAALLKKTGTGLDLLEINQHCNKVKKALQAREESKHQALLTGFGIKNDADDALETIEAPRFTPILIIVPSSVVDNWQNEFKTWGHFNVGVYAGSNREKALDRIKDGLDFILITGKSLFTRAGDYDELAQVEWKVVIVDEYHEFKNGKSQSFKRLQDLRDNCECPIVGMTGTLMQNKHEELFFLIDLVRPGLIGSKEAFRNEISRPITYARAKDAKQKVLDLAEEREQILRNAIRPAFLERKKEVVLKDELTEKKEEVIFCELTDIQKKIYRHIIALPDYQQLRFANAPCDCGVNKQYFRGYKKMKTHREQLDYQRRNKGILTLKKECCYRYPWNPLRDEPGEPQIEPDAILWKQSHEKEIGCPIDIAQNVIDGKYVACQNCPTCTTLVAMHKLYKISSHPNLLQVDRLESAAAQKKKLEFAKVAFTPEILKEMPGGSYYKSDGIMDDHMKLSGKMRTLDYCLTKFLKRRNRVLVFSYSTAALDVIQNHIKCKGWSNMRLDGKTPTNQRQGLVDKFQNGDTQVFLISTKAGGLGLNLTAANKVIIFDVNWNPSYDEQAQDRAFRIGQKRNVQIVRLVARGTIEELMYARQVYKVQLKKQTLGHNTDGKNQPQLFRGVAKDKNRKGELFGLENLLKFKDGSFMASLWKAKDDPNATHDLADLANELENMDEDKLDDIAEEGDEGPKDTRKNPKKKKSKGKYDSSDSDDESDDDDFKGEGGKINHDHLFAQSKGGAQVAQGDDDFDEEMGGESQIIEVTTKMACEEIGSDDDEDEEEEEEEDDNAATPDDYVPLSARNKDVKPVVKPEPVKSSKPIASTIPSNPDGNAASNPSPVKSSNAAAATSSSMPLVPSPVQSSSVNATASNKTSTNNKEEEDDDKTVPVPAAPQPSPVQSNAAKEGKGKLSTTAANDSDDDKTEPIPPVATTSKTSTNNGESDDDDKTVPVPQPSPVQSSAVNGGGEKAAIGNGNATSQSKATTSNKFDSSDDEVSPGLKTQPPTTVKKKKKKKVSKVAILGSVFETKKGSGKKSSGIYMPSYKK